LAAWLVFKDTVKTGKLYLAYITRLTEWQLVNSTVTWTTKQLW